MTIIASFTIQQRLWRGWSDPGLPVGAYIGATTVTGDASGGTERIDFDFAGEGEPVSGRYYNVEMMTSHHTDAVTTVGSLVAVNWEAVGPTGLADRRWPLAWVSDGDSNSELSQLNSILVFPFFLGKPQAVPALSTTLSFRQDNVLNRVMFATIQGYIWEPRSNLVEGGLRRPVESVYG